MTKNMIIYYSTSRKIMPICNVCGGYFIRAPCPICAEEHVPETMSPTAGISKDSLRAEVSVEGSINASIQSAEDQITQVKADIETEKEKWIGQIEEQKKVVDDLQAKLSDLETKEQTLEKNVLDLKEKKAKLQVDQNKAMDAISKAEQAVSNLQKEKQEKESKLQYLKDELASLGA